MYLINNIKNEIVLKALVRTHLIVSKISSKLWPFFLATAFKSLKYYFKFWRKKLNDLVQKRTEVHFLETASDFTIYSNRIKIKFDASKKKVVGTCNISKSWRSFHNVFFDFVWFWIWCIFGDVFLVLVRMYCINVLCMFWHITCDRCTCAFLVFNMISPT